MTAVHRHPERKRGISTGNAAKAGDELSANAPEPAGAFFLHIPSTLRPTPVHRLPDVRRRGAARGLSTQAAAFIIIISKVN
jgi:hypothetical protein